MSHGARGFTLVEVLVALMIVALGLTALLVTVSGTARSSGYLREKTLAQWIALNRLAEVRLNVNKFGQNTDKGEVTFGGRPWHYDTRYFDTSIGTMKRVVVRVYLGDAKAKGNALAESTSFLGTAVNAPGTSNGANWAAGTAPATPGNGEGTTTPAGGTATPRPGAAPITPIAPTPNSPTADQSLLQ